MMMCRLKAYENVYNKCRFHVIPTNTRPTPWLVLVLSVQLILTKRHLQLLLDKLDVVAIASTYVSFMLNLHLLLLCLGKVVSSRASRPGLS